jgi:dUTP pyrophosphatase
MANIGTTPVRIERGDRIAQIVIAPVSHVRWLEVPALDDTARGAGGFGSTGVQ